MKRLLAIALALLLCSPLVGVVEATITTTTNTCFAHGTSTNSASCNMPGNTTTGNTIVCGVYWDGLTAEGDLTSVSDGTNSFALRTTTYGTRDSQGQKFADAISIVGLTTPGVTATFSASHNNIVLACQEVTNVAVGGFDQGKSNAPASVGTGTDAATTGATGTRAQANEVLFGFINATNAAPNFTVGTGYTNIQNQPSLGMEFEYKVVSAVGTDAATWTISTTSNLIMSIGTYKDVVAGGGGGGSGQKARDPVRFQ